MEKITVVTTNSSSPDGNLNWKVDSPKKRIVVGGFMLSRGLTLNGLTVSYYMRNSVMYDTMMQMGRWFGYRDNYRDLLKLWATNESIDNFTKITRALSELTESIRIMNRNGNLGPKDFGLRVRSHLSSTGRVKPSFCVSSFLEDGSTP